MSTPLDLEKLVAAAHRWRGTPFRPNSADCGKQGGVCCHLLVGALYREAGHDVGEIPLGPPGHARSCATSIMTPWLDSSPHFKTVKLGEGFEAGDLLGFNLLGTLHHLAILLPRDQIVHSIYGVGVSITPRLDSTWHSRHAATWRPIAASK